MDGGCFVTSDRVDDAAEEGCERRGCRSGTSMIDDWVGWVVVAGRLRAGAKDDQVASTQLPPVVHNLPPSSFPSVKVPLTFCSELDVFA